MNTDPLFIFPTDTLPAPEIHIGNCLTILRSLPEQSIDCCVTSPPYFGLRDYQTGTWVGGDPACSHATGKGSNVRQTKHPNADNYPVASHRGGDSTHCKLCGAIRIDEQVGLEHTPDSYVEKLVSVFDEVHRVLKNHGSLWLNLGDSYSNDGKWGGSSGGKHAKALHGATGIGRAKVQTGLKPKDLLGMPWRVAFALQAAGWFLRSDIIWQKPNCLPESVQDRPTSSHEHVFLLTKQPYYYYDASAIAEPVVADARYEFGSSENTFFHESAPPTTRNARNVWSIPVRPYRDAHFATMPLELAQRCILAGSSEKGCCASCGKPWRRVQASWMASCQCLADIVPSRVLDPFGGAGTTGMIARRLNRQAILIELNPQYADLARKRIEHDKSQM